MKSLLIIFSLLLPSLSSVLYWNFEEDDSDKYIRDISGFANDALIHDGIRVYDEEKHSKVLKLVYDHQDIVVSPVKGLEGAISDSFSVNFWIKPTAYGKYWQQLDSGWGRFKFRILESGKIQMGIGSPPNMLVTKDFVSDSTLPLNEWTMISFTFNTSTSMGQAYWNGQFLGGREIPSGTQTWNYFQLWRIDGYLDDIGIYNYTLSKEEIESKFEITPITTTTTEPIPTMPMTTAITPTTSVPTTTSSPITTTLDIILHWNFNETGDKIVDYSGMGNSPDLGNKVREYNTEINKNVLCFYNDTNLYSTINGFKPNSSFSVAFWINSRFYYNKAVFGTAYPEIMIRWDKPGRFTGGITENFQHNNDGTTIILEHQQNNVWYHIAFTYEYEATYARYYVDGILRKAKITPSGEPWSGFNIKRFEGCTADVRVYNRRLTTSEVVHLYNGRDPNAGPPDGTPYYLAEERYVQKILFETQIPVEWGRTEKWVRYTYFAGKYYLLIVSGDELSRARPEILEITVDENDDPISLDKAYLEDEDYSPVWQRYYHAFTMEVDNKGFIHVAGGMRDFPEDYGMNMKDLPERLYNSHILYWRSTAPGDIHSMKFMGNNKTACPGGYGFAFYNFHRDRKGTLFFGSRVWPYVDKLGNNTVTRGAGLSRYDEELQSWKELGTYYKSLGREARSASIFYETYTPPEGRPFFWMYPFLDWDINNRLHVAFVANKDTNGINYSKIYNILSGKIIEHYASHIAYMYSDDGGDTFYNTSGVELKLPASVFRQDGSQTDVAWQTNNFTDYISHEWLNVVADYEGNPLIYHPVIPVSQETLEGKRGRVSYFKDGKWFRETIDGGRNNDEDNFSTTPTIVGATSGLDGVISYAVGSNVYRFWNLKGEVRKIRLDNHSYNTLSHNHAYLYGNIIGMNYYEGIEKLVFRLIKIERSPPTSTTETTTTSPTTPPTASPTTTSKPEKPTTTTASPTATSKPTTEKSTTPVVTTEPLPTSTPLPTSAPSNDELILHWKFDGDSDKIRDYSGFDNSPDVKGARMYDEELDMNVLCLNDKMRISSTINGFNSVKSFSISYWIRPEQFGLYMGSDLGEIRIRYRGQSGPGSFAGGIHSEMGPGDWGPNTPIHLEKWNHIVLTFEDDLLRFYRDGKLRAEKTFGTSKSMVKIRYMENYRLHR